MIDYYFRAPKWRQFPASYIRKPLKKRPLKSACVLYFLLSSYFSSTAQTYFNVLPDSVKIVNAELIIGNNTQQVNGLLYNTGNGVTQFRKLQLEDIGDSAISIAGQDTIGWSNKGSAGKYFVLSKDFAMQPDIYYHPLAFLSPLDSGKLYQVHALIILYSTAPGNNTSAIVLHYSGITLHEVPAINTSVNVTGKYSIYSFKYDKLIRSNAGNDSLWLSFETSANNPRDSMYMNSMSYMYVEEVNPKEYSE